MGTTQVDVALGDRSYTVHVTSSLSGLGAALRALFTAQRVVVVTDTNVAPHWADLLDAELATVGIEVERITVAAGEANKTRETWWSIVDGALLAGVDRHTPIVALGGGVVGDLAGFAAASVMRGVPFVQVPTTLLAMVDSSVGGKTGFNHPSGKNLVGAFHQPSLVWAAMDTLTTLPNREVRAGLGEVVKTAMLSSSSLFEELEANATGLGEGDISAMAQVVAACVEVKAEVVAADEREGGWRAVLNLGHTVAHGLEAALGYGELLHGEAVAIGLVAEATWAVAHGYCDDEALPGRVAAVLRQMGLPHASPQADAQRVLEAMLLDKKGAGDTLTLPVPVRLGKAMLVKLPKHRLTELVPTA